MTAEFDHATDILNIALDRYNSICTQIRGHYALRTGRQTDHTPELTARVAREISRASLYETEILNCKALLSQLRNFSKFHGTSFNILPPEVLVRIFEDVVDIHPCPALDYRLCAPSKVRFLQGPVILSHVCSHWRRIIVNTASLWSHIDIDPIQALTPKSSARLKAYMDRSAGAVLDFHITERPKSSNELPHIMRLEIDPVITSLLALAAPRVRSLTLSVSPGNEGVYHSFLKTCFSGCTPGIFTGVSIRSAEVDCARLGPLLLEIDNLQPAEDEFTGLLSEATDAVWDSVKTLQLKAYRPVWTSKAYLGLTSLRLVRVGKISHMGLQFVLQFSPQLRVLELDFDLTKGPLDNPSITPVRLDNLEILIVGGSKEKQLGLIVQLIAPGSRPLSLSIVNPYITSPYFTSRDELARFAARSNITRLCTHEIMNYPQLIEVLELIPTVRVVAVDALDTGAIDRDVLSPDISIHTFYVLNSCSRFGGVTWPQIEKFVEKHHVQRLVLWRYDFRYSGLSVLAEEKIPDNLYAVCPVVNVIPKTDPNPIMDWFGE